MRQEKGYGQKRSFHNLSTYEYQIFDSSFFKKKITRVLSLSMMVQQGHDGDLADGGRISNTLINEQGISLSPWADH